MSASAMPAIAKAVSLASGGARGERLGRVAAGMSLPHAPDVDRRLLADRARARRGDDDREAAVRDQAAVEQVEGLHHPARAVVVLDGHRRIVELRLRIHCSPIARSATAMAPRWSLVVP